MIIIFPTELRPILDNVDTSGTLNNILVDGLGEALLTIGIPLFAGLVWNKWAGGGAGFLLGDNRTGRKDRQGENAGQYPFHDHLPGQVGTAEGRGWRG